MIEFLKWYVSVGCAIYIMFTIRDATTAFKSFRQSTVMDVLRGAMIIPLWPALPWVVGVIK